MTNDEKKMLMARQRMTATAASLHHVLGGLNAAGLLIGAACGVLATEFGDAKAAEYLREVADAIEADDGDDADQAPAGRLQ